MLPKVNDGLINDFDFKTQPSKTYKLDHEIDRIGDYTDNLDAMRQAVFLILNIEKRKNEIYSDNYGAELDDLIGKPYEFVMAKAQNRIADALLQDDRISAVDNFSFEKDKRSIKIYFTVHTIFGNIETERTVNI